jgi:type I restriction enzyme S subunit
MKRNKQIQKNIPEGWKTIKLGDIATIGRGGSPRPIEFYITDKKDGLNWLRIGDVDLGAKYIYKTSQKIKKEGLHKTTLVNEGDFILSNSMSYGRPYIMKTSACIHDGWLALMEIKTELIGKDFLYYLLSSRKIQNTFISISAGSGVQNLKKETVINVLVNLPLVGEQNRIAKVLEIWDEVIEKLGRKIEVKGRIKKGLMRELLTGKTRLSGFSGKWETVAFDAVCKINMGQSPSSIAYNEQKNGLPLIQGNNDIKFRKTIRRIWTTEITKTADIGDIIMTVRAPVGCIGIAIEKVCIGRGVCAITPLKINHNYILKFLEHKEPNWKSLEQGSTFTAVNSLDIKKLQINIPISREEQNAIADILTVADEEIAGLERKLAILSEQKKFLLNNLITGAIRTPNNL